MTSDCPPAASCATSDTTASGAARFQRARRGSQASFFALFILAPILDIFRLDLQLGHFILFGQSWTLGLDPLLAGEASGLEAAANLILRGALPLFAIVGLLGWVAWRYGRLYCGWLCPHFSVVEFINGLMRRATGKPSLWEPKALPELRPDGKRVSTGRVYWLPTILAILGFGFLWALVLLTYLLPPTEIYSNLIHARLTPNQGLFLAVASTVFASEFLLARHLFCRFGCAVGVFQSIVWMVNKKAMVVGFDRARATDCKTCNAACEHVCPMRLKPRTIKRRMFTCTQCASCIDACAQVQAGGPGNAGKIQAPLLQWVQDECATEAETAARDSASGQRRISPSCFRH